MKATSQGVMGFLHSSVFFFLHSNRRGENQSRAPGRRAAWCDKVLKTFMFVVVVVGAHDMLLNLFYLCLRKFCILFRSVIWYFVCYLSWPFGGHFVDIYCFLFWNLWVCLCLSHVYGVYGFCRRITMTLIIPDNTDQLSQSFFHALSYFKQIQKCETFCFTSKKRQIVSNTINDQTKHIRNASSILQMHQKFKVNLATACFADINLIFPPPPPPSSHDESQ